MWTGKQTLPVNIRDLDPSCAERIFQKSLLFPAVAPAAEFQSLSANRTDIRGPPAPEDLATKGYPFQV